jgi:hypothetical protein
MLKVKESQSHQSQVLEFKVVDYRDTVDSFQPF